MNNWQPIETAPKDETVILIHSANVRVTQIAFWRGSQRDGFWTNTLWKVVNPPTHWQPLPEPPNE